MISLSVDCFRNTSTGNWICPLKNDIALITPLWVFSQIYRQLVGRGQQSKEADEHRERWVELGIWEVMHLLCVKVSILINRRQDADTQIFTHLVFRINGHGHVEKFTRHAAWVTISIHLATHRKCTLHEPRRTLAASAHLWQIWINNSTAG